MAFAIVQHASNGSAGLNITVTLGSAPTVNNIMVAVAGQVGAVGITDITPPSGWTAIDDTLLSRVSLGAWFRIVQSGDGAAYTWTSGQNVDANSAAIVEISGNATSSPINAHAINAALQTASTTWTTPTITQGGSTLAVGYVVAISLTGGAIGVASAGAGFTIQGQDQQLNTENERTAQSTQNTSPSSSQSISTAFTSANSVQYLAGILAIGSPSKMQAGMGVF